jgi:diguanylate cyclase
MQGKMDEITCSKVYKRFLSEAARDEAVKKISDQVHQAIAEIAAVVSSAKTSTSDYSESLQDVTTQIKSATSLDDLSAVVGKVVADTKRIVHQQKELEDQLVNSSSQVAELKKNLENVRKEAMTDGLTGLANRKSFDRYLRNCIVEAEENKKPFTLLMMDIDFFKSFNDNYGHQIGDQVIRLVARTLTDGVKGRDVAARYGGEEFAVILPESGVQAGIVVGNAIRKAIESKEVVNRTTNENLGKITISVGVAEYKPGEDASAIIDRADAALYDAKHNGRNQVVAAP